MVEIEISMMHHLITIPHFSLMHKHENYQSIRCLITPLTIEIEKKKRRKMVRLVQANKYRLRKTNIFAFKLIDIQSQCA